MLILKSALAFMAGYGLKSFLIAQLLNQIEKWSSSVGAAALCARG